MSIESDLTAALRIECQRVFSDFATVQPATPYVIWHGIGGRAMRALDNTAFDKREVRVTVTSWATSRQDANALAQAIEQRLCSSSAFAAIPEAEAAAISEPDNTPPLYGAQQDFRLRGPR